MLDRSFVTEYNTAMDLKVYRKEEVQQPEGTMSVVKPDIIDIFPITAEVEATDEIRNNIWSLERLKQIADVKVENNKLIINSDNVTYRDGKLFVTLTESKLLNADILDDDTKEATLQKCALATIYQRGLDPLEPEDGIRWSEAYLEEINPVQLMGDILDSVSAITTAVNVNFDTVQGNDGQEYLTYNLKFIA